MTDVERAVALDYARQIGTGLARLSIILGVTLCDSPEYKHFILDTLYENGLIDHERSMSTDLLAMREDPRVKEFIRAWNTEVALCEQPF